jgi:hypothetical protein
MDSRPMTAAQRHVAAALAFLASAAVAGIALIPDGVEYRAFGMVEGVFALLLAYLLVFRGAWDRPETLTGWMAVAYGVLASAQVMELLLPPPGMIEWMVVAGIAVSAWGAFSGGTRRRLVFSLASLALLLAVIKFSVIPVNGWAPPRERALAWATWRSPCAAPLPTTAPCAPWASWWALPRWPCGRSARACSGPRMTWR